MEVLRQAAAIIFVLILLLCAMWAMRRKGGMRIRLSTKPASNPGKSLELLERAVLTPQHSLHRIRAGGRELLVAAHPGGCDVVCEIHHAVRNTHET
jgi:flagellar biogenesis protein FliO